MNTGVYRILNIKTGDSYIGSAVNFERRWADHRSSLQQRKHHNRRLQQSWDACGAGDFEFQVLLVCCPADLIFYEQRAIDGLKPEYNIAPKAGSSLGVKLPSVAAANRRRIWTDESRRRAGAAFQKGVQSERWRNSMAAVFANPEYRANMSLATTGIPKPAHFGQKIRLALAGKPKSNDHADKCRAALAKGRRIALERRKEKQQGGESVESTGE